MIATASSATFLAHEYGFTVPLELEASTPPEYRGIQRDQVKLMVLDRVSGETIHTRFDRIDMYLRAGDLLVANASRMIPALLPAVDEHGRQVEVRLAHQRTSDTWEAIILEERQHVGYPGMHLRFFTSGSPEAVMDADITGRRSDLPFLFYVRFSLAGIRLLDAIYRIGQPIRYYYVQDNFPLDLYQTVYATIPGSVEMPSAGRGISWQLLTRLKRKGIGFTTLLLHTGLSSTRDDAIDALHPNYDEEYRIPDTAATAINRTRCAGGRIVAVGTTVVRALETVVDQHSRIEPGQGWTNLHINGSHQLRVVDGLITGMHEPAASHLELLHAFIAPHRLHNAYREALARDYLWHEFGDMNLII